MNIPIFHIDTFTSKIFKGNPAAVCILESPLPEAVMQMIAIENALPVTAFLAPSVSGFFLRWFTPDYELDLCGHGTLAAAHVVFNILKSAQNNVEFHSNKAGVINVLQKENLIELNFPAKTIELTQASQQLIDGLGVIPATVYQHNNERLLVVLNHESEVKTLAPNMQVLATLERRGIVVSAKSKTVDFVSRTFYPQKTATEDAVTGASHCLLVPYWAQQLNKTQLHAQQVSARGGELFCNYQNERVYIAGEAVLYLRGMLTI